MAVIKKKQMKELGAEDVKKKISELRLELSKDRAQTAIGGTPTNPGRTREMRRTIARLLTRLHNSSPRPIHRHATIARQASATEQNHVPGSSDGAIPKKPKEVVKTG